jgi:hypothetical protein
MRFLARTISPTSTTTRAKDGVKFAAFKAEIAQCMGIEQAQELGGYALNPVLPIGPPGRPEEFADAPSFPAAHPLSAQRGSAVLRTTRHGHLLKRR